MLYVNYKHLQYLQVQKHTVQIHTDKATLVNNSYGYLHFLVDCEHNTPTLFLEASLSFVAITATWSLCLCKRAHDVISASQKRLDMRGVGYARVYYSLLNSLLFQHAERASEHCTIIDGQVLLHVLYNVY